MGYNLIAAVCKKRGIGKDGHLPWRLPEDLALFSAITKGGGNNAVVMGRRTWESLPKRPLAGRENLVISRNPSFDPGSGARSFTSIDGLNAHCEEAKYNAVWVAGGAQVYEAFLDRDLIDVCAVTFIDKECDVDTFLPLLSREHWGLRYVKKLQTKCGTGAELRQFVRYERALPRATLELNESAEGSHLSK
tara:strand:+ start:966 stop:1538 length:573 start_codon:yes stop_codon:yes gene_type:complete